MVANILVNHYEQPTVHRMQVFFQGTGALSAGTGVCWVPEKVTTNSGETAADAWGKRSHIVDVPATGREQYFAGVVLHDYVANANGQNIYIALPGSAVEVYVNEAVSIGDTIHCIVDETTAAADNGQFMKDPLGMPFLGAAVAMQTTSSADALILAKLMDAPEGFNSGMIQLVTPTDDDAISGCTLSGTTMLPATTLGTGNCTYTLADGTFIGQRKAFKLSGAMTTNDFVITITNGLQLDDSTALATLTMDGSGDYTLLEWLGDVWRCLRNSGTAIA